MSCEFWMKDEWKYRKERKDIWKLVTIMVLHGFGYLISALVDGSVSGGGFCGDDGPCQSLHECGIALHHPCSVLRVSLPILASLQWKVLAVTALHLGYAADLRSTCGYSICSSRYPNLQAIIFTGQAAPPIFDADSGKYDDWTMPCMNGTLEDMTPAVITTVWLNSKKSMTHSSRLHTFPMDLHPAGSHGYWLLQWQEGNSIHHVFPFWLPSGHKIQMPRAFTRHKWNTEFYVQLKFGYNSGCTTMYPTTWI